MEEERAINRALSRPSSPRGRLSRPTSPRQLRSPSPSPAPAPPLTISRIPKISAPAFSSTARRPSRDTSRANRKLSRASSTSQPHPTPTRFENILFRYSQLKSPLPNHQDQAVSGDKRGGGARAPPQTSPPAFRDVAATQISPGSPSLKHGGFQ